MMGLLFFAKRVVWFFWDNPRYLVMLLAFIILVLIGMQMKGCFTRTPKFNEDEIRRAQKAIADDSRKEMVEVLVDEKVAPEQLQVRAVSAMVIAPSIRASSSPTTPPRSPTRAKCWLSARASATTRVSSSP